ncbi:MAG: aminotransferase class V-fold PLP-dependent enzyme [Syntrophomonadaceae bacterium]|nr:aminotransferase class V-fold PLP-dependent enzyme [Syntrophomonadaceae bacterium]
MGRAGFCLKDFRRQIVGIDMKVPGKDRRRLKYINFDNAASTPALEPVVKRLQHHLKWYSGVHRGTGYKSLVSTHEYNRSREVIADFVQADLDHDAVIFLKNTTEAINKLSYRIGFKPGDQVLVSGMEHHSNDLPWRSRVRVNYAGLDEKGRLDLSDLEEKLKRGYPRTRLVGICGASNVTGHINDIHHIAALAHEYRAQVLVDGAQLVPHHPIDMKPIFHPGHIDFLAFSGHKIYAPYGCGVLIGPRDTFEQGIPEYAGGGTIRAVHSDAVYWADPPEKEEAGSPNVLGVVGLADTLSYLKKVGVGQMSEYEASLTEYTLNRMSEVRGLSVYGDGPRVAVISFNLAGVPHSLVGAILCYEAGIGLRTGCFCAQPYVRYLMGEREQFFECLKSGGNCKEPMPGMVRISLAAYNTRAEIDHLVEWLKRISGNRQEFIRRYRYDDLNDEYLPRDYDVAMLSSRLGKSLY